MSVSIRIKSGEDRPFAVDIRKFPATIRIDNNPLRLAALPFVLVFLLVFSIIIGNVVPAIAIIVVPVLLIVAGLLLFLVLRRRGRQNILLFGRKGVLVTEAGLLRDSNWQADYDEFEGVRLRRRQARQGRGHATYQIIELKHPDPRKTLPLFVEKGKRTPEKRWHSYGELFGLPTIRE